VTAKASPVRRWTSVLLRALHLVAVIGFSVDVLGAAKALDHRWPVAVVVSGVVLFAVLYWGRPDRLREVSAASMFAKLALIAAMVALPDWQTPLLWCVVVWSVIFAHAPASFRHARIGSPGLRHQQGPVNAPPSAARDPG
jgi:hypothetical protein